MGDPNKIIFKVEAMSCNHCKQSIESAVKAMEGVTGATVDLEQNLVEVTFDPRALKEEALKAAVTNAGYQLIE